MKFMFFFYPLVETANPEWFIWRSDQGYLLLEQVKVMPKRFGNEVLPYYLSTRTRRAAPKGKIANSSVAIDW